MNGVEELLNEAHALGARFTLNGERVTISAPSPLPSHLLDRLRDNKAQVVEYLHERFDFEPWMLKEWRRISTPEWRLILQVSIDRGERRREKYARWMLREVLLDPEYEEPAE